MTMCNCVMGSGGGPKPNFEIKVSVSDRQVDRLYNNRVSSL